MTFWKGKKVLVTGGSGLLGTAVVAHLRLLGAKVAAPPSSILDIVSQVRVDKFFQEHGPYEYVYNLAGKVGGIGANQSAPGEFFYQNMQMGISMMQVCAQYPIKKLIQVGSTCSYPKNASAPLSESSLFDGPPEPTNAPYGVAKRDLLVMAKAYEAQYELKSNYLVLANLYGPGCDYDPKTSHVIPALVKKFSDAVSNGEDRVTVWGTGKAEREFLHVKDAARALALAGERLNTSDPINVGYGETVSIRDLALMIANQTGFTGSIIYDISKPDGNSVRLLENTKAKLKFGFESHVDLCEGIQSIVEDYRENHVPV